MAEDEDTKPLALPTTSPVRNASSGSAESCNSSGSTASSNSPNSHFNFCSVCQAPVSNTIKSQWLHRWLHAEKSFYFCKICQDKFDDFEMLKKHERIHLGSSLQELTQKQPLKTINGNSIHEPGDPETSKMGKHGVEGKAVKIFKAEEVVDAVNTVAVTCDQDLSADPSSSGQEALMIDFKCEFTGCKDSLQTRQQSKRQSSDRSQEIRMEPCAKCDMLFSSLKSYQQHLRQAHNEITVYPCMHCGKIFYSNVTLYEHIETIHKIFTGIHCQPGFLKPPAFQDQRCDHFIPQQSIPTSPAMSHSEAANEPPPAKIPKYTGSSDGGFPFQGQNYYSEQPRRSFNQVSYLTNSGAPPLQTRPTVLQTHTTGTVQTHHFPFSASQNQNVQLKAYPFHGIPHQRVHHNHNTFQSNNSKRNEISLRAETDHNYNMSTNPRKNSEGITRAWAPQCFKKEDHDPAERDAIKNVFPMRDRPSSKRPKLTPEQEYQQHAALVSANEHQQRMLKNQLFYNQQFYHPTNNMSKIPASGYSSQRSCHPHYSLPVSGEAAPYPSPPYYYPNTSYNSDPNRNRICSSNGPCPNQLQNGICYNKREVVQSHYHDPWYPYPYSNQVPQSSSSGRSRPFPHLPPPHHHIRQVNSKKLPGNNNYQERTGSNSGYGHPHRDGQFDQEVPRPPEKVLKNTSTTGHKNRDLKGPVIIRRSNRNSSSLGQVTTTYPHPSKYVQQSNFYETSNGSLQLDDVYYPTNNDAVTTASVLGGDDVRHNTDDQVIRFYRGVESGDASTTQVVLQVSSSIVKDDGISKLIKNTDKLQHQSKSKSSRNLRKIKNEPEDTRTLSKAKKLTGQNKTKCLKPVVRIIRKDDKAAQNSLNDHKELKNNSGNKTGADINSVHSVNESESEIPMTVDEPQICNKIQVLGDNFILLLDPKTVEVEDSALVSNEGTVCENISSEKREAVPDEVHSNESTAKHEAIEVAYETESCILLEEDQEYSIKADLVGENEVQEIFSCPLCQQPFLSELNAKVHEVCMHVEIM